MAYSKNVLTLMVSAAVALIVVTNFCILLLLHHPGNSASELASAVWPIALPSTVAIVLVMSTLHQSLQEVLSRLAVREREANELARHDPLTGLANKRLLEERVQAAIAHWRRQKDRFAVLMIDLDHFKRVNDVLGHPIGDRLLKLAADRLQLSVRDGDTVARFGGDEFLILAKASKPSEVDRLCRRMLYEMAKPYEVDGTEVSLSASIGVAYSTSELGTSEEYVRAADVALYAAKADGRSCVRFFTDELDAELQRRSILELDLRKCLSTGDRICVHYQPQLDSTGNLTGVECLFRWRHPELGEIPAGEAISIAEETRQIDALGEFVLGEAAIFAKAHPVLSVAVNVSPAQFCHQHGLAHRFTEIVSRHSVHPRQIELEITEQLFMRQSDRCEQQMDQLRAAGFRLALDDFGTGYSSLSYLRRFKVDRLKLDRSFVSEGESPENIAVIRAAVTLAHAMGLEVVAEGIETAAQEAIALEAGCDALQGNRYAAALDREAIEGYLNSRTRAAA